MLSIFSCACWSFVFLLWRRRKGFFPLGKEGKKKKVYWVVYLLLSCMNRLHTFEMKPLLIASFLNIPCYSVGCVLMLFLVSFPVQKPVNLIRFVFISIALGDWP